MTKGCKTRGYGHPTVKAYVYHKDGSPAGAHRLRNIFRNEHSPNYGILSDGTVVLRKQVGMSNMHKWYLEGTRGN